MEFELLRKLRPHQVPNPINRLRDGIVEIVNDGNPKPFIKKLDNGVRANEPGPAGYQNSFLRRRHLRLKLTKQKVFLEKMNRSI